MTVETKICILNKRVAWLVVYLFFWSKTRLRNQTVGILRGKENDIATYGEAGGPTSPAGPTEPIVFSMYVHASCCRHWQSHSWTLALLKNIQVVSNYRVEINSWALICKYWYNSNLIVLFALLFDIVYILNYGYLPPIQSHKESSSLKVERIVASPLSAHWCKQCKDTFYERCNPC